MTAPGAQTPPGPAPGAAAELPPPGAPIVGPLSIAAIYRRSLKPKDLRFNNWVCRPPAAVLVYLLRPTPVTPNQITFLSLLVSLLSAAALVLLRQPLGLWLAAALVYLAFVLDCVDGQLARITGKTSVVGAYLDFLVDEIKAVTLIAACAGRLAWTGAPALGGPLEGTIFWLVVGLVGVAVASSGMSLTTFMRRPEYFEATTGQKAVRVAGFTRFEEPKPAAPPSLVKTLVRLPIRLLEETGKLVLHYPAWFYIPALLGHLEWFLFPYLLAHTMYLGRSGLVVLSKLGR
jgi:phosphatidylglycerophosphate synthase